MNQTFFLGGQLVVMHKFDFAAMAQAVQDYKVNVLPVVPPVMLALTKSPLTSKFDWSSVEKVIVGAAPTSEELQRAAQAALPNATIYQGFGALIHLAIHRTKLTR